MRASRLILLRRGALLGRFVSTTPRCLMAAIAQPELRPPNDDFVRTVVHSLIDQNEQDMKHSISIDDIDKSLQYFQNLLQEARHCISDCKNLEGNFDEEMQTAEKALERAAYALVEWLDLLRGADEQIARNYKHVREASAAAIRELRQELASVQPR